MKFTYWLARRIDDNEAYSLRFATKRECLVALQQNAAEWGRPWSERYEPPRRVTAHHYDKLDLIQQCLGEGRASWEV